MPFRSRMLAYWRRASMTNVWRVIEARLLHVQPSENMILEVSRILLAGNPFDYSFQHGVPGTTILDPLARLKLKRPVAETG